MARTSKGEQSIEGQYNIRYKTKSDLSQVVWSPGKRHKIPRQQQKEAGIAFSYLSVAHLLQELYEFEVPAAYLGCFFNFITVTLVKLWAVLLTFRLVPREAGARTARSLLCPVGT